MPRKRDAVRVALGAFPKEWNKYLLKTYGLPQEPQPRYEVSESAFVGEDGRRTPLEQIAAEFGIYAGFSLPECAPTKQWKRSQDFLRIMALIFACNNKLSKERRIQLLKNVDDLNPNSPLPDFDESFGTPEEFLECWRCHELDVRFVNMADSQAFEVRYESIPPDEPEDFE